MFNVKTRNVLTLSYCSTLMPYFNQFFWGTELVGMWVALSFLLPSILAVFLCCTFLDDFSSDALIFLVMAIGVALCSLSVGFLNHWPMRDILVDTFRFFLPFLMFAGVVASGTRMSLDELLDVFNVTIKLAVVVVLVSLVYKLFLLATGRPIFEYARGTILVPLICFFSLYVLKDKFKYKISIINIRSIVLCLFFISPVLSMSKTLSIVMLSAIIMIILSDYKQHTGKVLLSLVVMFVSITFYHDNVMSALDLIFYRFIELYSTLADFDPTASLSTGARLAESLNVLYTLRENIPLSIPFGMGSGALWYDNLGLYSGGLSDHNFREGGGGHHVHLTLVALLFRYGFFGWLILTCFVLYNLRVSYYLARSRLSIDSANSIGIIFLFYILASFITSIFTYAIYDSYEFFFLTGILIAIKNKVNYSSG